MSKTIHLLQRAFMAYQAIISCVAIMGDSRREWLSICWELEKSCSESVLHGVNDSAKWQPDLYPSAAIAELIVSATKYVHLQESHFLVFV